MIKMIDKILAILMADITIEMDIEDAQTEEQIEADIAEAWAQRKRVTP